jgi:hypothetical protein
VAFANTHGGIVIVGVAAPHGTPTGMPGFERASEVALDITNQINSCIHPADSEVFLSNDTAFLWPVVKKILADRAERDCEQRYR